MTAGAPSASEIRLLLERVRRLELIARRNVSSRQVGDWTTSVRGEGLLLAEHRKYVPGQPARRIDWNVTARLDEPYVKLHEEERRREVMLAVDVSPSMHGGFGERTKLEVAVELAATLAVSAIDAGDRLGCLLFADELLAEVPPAPGRRQLFAVLRALLEAVEPWERPVGGSDPRAAIHALERSARRRRVVFLISDFLDHDVPEDLRFLRPRHDVSLIWVHDPVEEARAPQIRLLGRPAEGAGRWRSFSPDGGAGAAEPVSGPSALAEAAAPYGIEVLATSTEEQATRAIGRLVGAKRRRRR